jgi:hypothetical protein
LDPVQKTYLQIYCGVFYTVYRVTSSAYADSYLPICRAIGARVRILVSRVDPFAHHHHLNAYCPTGQLRVIEVDIRNRYYYSTTHTVTHLASIIPVIYTDHLED